MLSAPTPAPPVAAYFTARSYAPGNAATLVVLGKRRKVAVRIFRSGPEQTNRMPAKEMLGIAVYGPFTTASGRTRIGIGRWPSGLYFARLTAGSKVGYAPFVVRPRRIGEHRVAVVLPTNTWQAYNFLDRDGDGVGDTWYASPRVTWVDLARPFAETGAPPKLAQSELGFLRWLVRTGKSVDFLSDDDLNAVFAGESLARAYDVIVFAGHEEYVTRHMYNVIQRYRDLGGNLMFLSSNNFFWAVAKKGDRIARTGRWRDSGRPEARLVGIQYLDWNHDTWPNRPYLVTGAAKAPWLFAGTGLRNGSRFGTYGIEIDSPTADSPRGLQILASVPDVFGRGRSATMTFYRTRRGAKVFAAGTMGFGGSALWPPVNRLLRNLWAEFARP